MNETYVPARIMKIERLHGLLEECFSGVPIDSDLCNL